MSKYMIPAGCNKMGLKTCPFCGSKGQIEGTVFAFPMKDDRSLDEYKISGICNPCQDNFFKDGEERE